LIFFLTFRATEIITTFVGVNIVEFKFKKQEKYKQTLLSLILLRVLREKASSFLLDDFYRTPGGIQFEGSGADTKPITLTIEGQDYLGDIEILQDYLEKVCAFMKKHSSDMYLASEEEILLSNMFSRSDEDHSDMYLIHDTYLIFSRSYLLVKPDGTGEDHSEAWMLTGDSEGSNKLDGVSKRCAQGHVGSPQC
jgi:hypothetical protein